MPRAHQEAHALKVSVLWVTWDTFMLTIDAGLTEGFWHKDTEYGNSYQGEPGILH